MNISFSSRDAIQGILKIEIEKADYIEKTEKNLRSFRVKTTIPGFRKGMAPIGIIKKMYGKHLLADDLNSTVSEALSKYLTDNPDIKILGRPVPNETEQKDFDLGVQENFDFYFDIAFMPDFDIDLNKDDVLPYCKIIVDESMVDEQIELYKSKLGKYDEVDSSEGASENDIVKGKMTELENGLPKEGGIVVEEAVLLTKYMTGSSEAGKITGAVKGSTIVFNPRKAYEGSTSADTEIASLLAMAKQEVADLYSDFSFEIKSISQYKMADLDQNLFDIVFGKDTVSDLDGFRNKIRGLMNDRFVTESNNKFFRELRPYLLNKVGEIKLADDIIKRILLTDEEDKKSAETIDDEYAGMKDSIIYDIIINKIYSKHDLHVDDKDVEEVARQEVSAMLAQYNLYGAENMTDDLVSGMLKDDKKIRQFEYIATNEKLALFAKEAITLDIKELSVEEFYNLEQSSSSESPEKDVEDVVS